HGATLAVLHEIVPTERDAWYYTLDELGRFYERVLAELGEPDDGPTDGVAAWLQLAEGELPPIAQDAARDYLWAAELIGRRTADLHAALAGVDESAFAQQAFTLPYQRSMYQ